MFLYHYLCIIYGHLRQICDFLPPPPLYCNSNVDEAWLIFKSKFLSIVDNISPLRCVRLKQGTDPWMTAEVLHLIHEWNFCLERFKKTKCNDEWYEKYIALRNQVQNKKAVAKSEQALLRE